MNVSVSEAAALLREADDILILSHRRPDGDTAGCAGRAVPRPEPARQNRVYP